jgi:poly[(R)-3-hydroxyalkanoate] polymerase subunit PhaC
MHKQYQVEQTIDRRNKDLFYKEILTATTLDNKKIALVRKRSDRGKSPNGAVLLLHGFGQNRYSWHLKGRSFVNYLAQRGFDVFNADLRGVGRSHRLGSPLAESFDDYVNYDLPALLELVTEVSRHDRVFIIGHSLGGSLCYAGAEANRQSIGGIVTLGGLYNFTAGNKALQTATRAAQLAFDKGLFDLFPFDHIPLKPIGLTILLNGGVFNSPLGRLSPLKIYVPGSIEAPILRRRLTAGFDRASFGVFNHMTRWGAQGLFDSFDGMRDYREEFSGYDGPLMVIAADHDDMAGPENCYSAFEAACSDDKCYHEYSRKKYGISFGHCDLILGRQAPKLVWPAIAKWMEKR